MSETTTPSYKVEPDRMYTAIEVAHILRVSRFTIGRVIREGAIKTFKRGRSYIIYGKHLLDFIEREFN